MAAECSIPLLGYQLCQVATKQINQCFDNHQCPDHEDGNGC